MWFEEIRPERVKADDFMAVIEIQKGGKNKYEIDKETGMLRLDRVLYTSTHYPMNYGFVPLTYALDDDPLDVFVLCSESIQPLSLVRCYPIGAIKMIDNKSEDYKILAVPFGDPQYNYLKDYKELPTHVIDELLHFLQVYKQLEPNKTTEIAGFFDVEHAKQVIEISKQRFIEMKNKK